MTLSLAISSTWRWMFQRARSQEAPMPAVAPARPDWRLAQGRSWTPVSDEVQSITRIYTESKRILVAIHMPGGAYVSIHQRTHDGAQGRFVESYFISEPESEWPRTKALLEAVG